MDSFPWSRGSELPPDPVKMLLPDLAQLLDMPYVTGLTTAQLAAKLVHLRTLAESGRPRTPEFEGLRVPVRDNLLRVLFFHLTEGQLPKLRDLQNPDFLAGYPKARREKLLFGLDGLLGCPDLDVDLRMAVNQVREHLLQVYAAEMEGA